MSNSPTVSVIMNCLNCSVYLKEAIDSIYSQSYKNWEIIFWDNASTDNSAEIAKSYDERLKYFRSAETVTLGKSRNWAIDKACGEYVAFLDCDDMWLPDKLEKQILVFEKNKGVAFSYHNYYILYQNTGKKTFAFKGNMPQGKIFRDMLSNYRIGILSVIIRRAELFELDGFFDEILSFAEEYDLFMRLLFKHEALYINEPLAVYRSHKDNTGKKLYFEWDRELNHILNKFESLEDNFKDKYSKEIKDMKTKHNQNIGKFFMLQGDMKNARIHLTPDLTSSLTSLLLYVVTFLPIKLFNLMLHIQGKHS